MVFDETMVVVDVGIDRMHWQQMRLPQHYFVPESLVQLRQSPEFDLNYSYLSDCYLTMMMDVHMS